MLLTSIFSLTILIRGCLVFSRSWVRVFACACALTSCIVSIYASLYDNRPLQLAACAASFFSLAITKNVGIDSMISIYDSALTPLRIHPAFLLFTRFSLLVFVCILLIGARELSTLSK